MIAKKDLTFNLRGLKSKLIITKIKKSNPNFDVNDLF